MKKTILLNTSLLLVLVFWLMPTAFSQNRKLQKHQEQTTLWNVPGTVTISYYLDDEGNPIMHGKQVFSFKFDNTARRSPGVDARKVTIEGYIDHKDNKRDGGVNFSCELFENGNKANAKVNGTFKDDLMDGTWNVLGLQGVSSTFTIKDRRVTSFKINNGKDGAFTSDAQGKLSGTLKNYVIKNGIVTNGMKYKSGIESNELTPKAKAVLDQLSKREVSSKELVENGFYLEEFGEEVNLFKFVASALEQFSDLFKVDNDLNKPNYCSLLCQINDSQLASFEQCKKLLDEEQNNNGFSAMDNLADRMIENYEDGKGHYLKPEVVQAIEGYKSTAKEQWFAKAKKTINGMNDLASLFSFAGMVNNDVMAFPVEKRTELNNAIGAKYTDLVAKMKTNVEEETDYVALVNYYNSNVEPVKKDMADSDARSIDASYQKRRGELEKTVSAKIVDEMSRKESSKDLKEYYNSIQNVVASLPSNSSTIRSTYDNKYAELVRKEEKAERKAARRSKVINTLEWVGVGVAVVGGYLIYKYVLPEKE